MGARGKNRRRPTQVENACSHYSQPPHSFAICENEKMMESPRANNGDINGGFFFFCIN